jgi:lipoprotein signal peptidase
LNPMAPKASPDTRYWFPAKTYGWGWGLPTRWQGWVVLCAFIVAVVVVSIVLPPATHPIAFFASIGILSGILMVVCYLKGEPPSWRWGK